MELTAVRKALIYTFKISVNAYMMVGAIGDDHRHRPGGVSSDQAD